MDTLDVTRISDEDLVSALDYRLSKRKRREEELLLRLKSRETELVMTHQDIIDRLHAQLKQTTEDLQRSRNELLLSQEVILLSRHRGVC